MKKKTKIPLLVVLIVLCALTVYSVVNPIDIDNLKDYQSCFHATPFALLPPIIAIGLALMTKEVYSSLFIGIFSGALLYSEFNMELAVKTLFFNEDGGMVSKLSDSGNVGILVFLVMLGSMVVMMNKAGGSEAFGKWATKKIKTRVGASLATTALGVLIFVDDYFNCLTVGSVMRPVTDRHKISRAKLAYLIDATAAPICIIAPISSWAAAVTSSVPSDSGINGFLVFLRTIPYNYYAVLTIVMMLYLSIRQFDYGPMKVYEENAKKNGDLFTSHADEFEEAAMIEANPDGKVIDLVLPVVVLIAGCIGGMLYSGGFFRGVSLVTAFANASASVGLVIGGFIGLAFTFFFYMFRGVLTFEQYMECFTEGFKQMVSPILILTFAWTLAAITKLLGASVFVGDVVASSAGALQAFLPAVIFLVGMSLAFATGTSWGTFSILIPIVIGVFPSGEMMIIAIASCLSGAVCGDHCSPISDTTIMSSAGAQCHHVNHVSTQIPYALTVAGVSAVSYVISGFVQNVFICLPIAILMMLAVLRFFEIREKNKEY
ncbi:MAG: Na+/H+ antiporter NhaC family protein [Lachnospiraceae bacterium]|nr:Na+/H+ antiporter NhaC family protein [Lachnospiraceae bacterium]